MIRFLFGSTLTVLGFGAATALLGPDFVTGPRGEPLVVAGQRTASFQPASFDGTGCGAAAAMAAELPFADAAVAAGAHVVALTLKQSPDGMSLVVTDVASEAEAAVLLALDDAGRIVAVGTAPSVRERILAEAEADCLDTIKTKHTGI